MLQYLGFDTLQKSFGAIVVATASNQPLKHTPLESQHEALKAKMMPFGGWNMPVQYAGIKAEHKAVREKAGMFDISHMGKFWLEGEKVLDALQTLVPSDLNRLNPGQAKYTVFLNEEAGVIDDLIVYFLGEADGIQQVIVIVNAATTDKDKAWMSQHLPESITFNDWSEDRVLIAVQGPEAIAILQSMTDDDLSEIKNYRHAWGKIEGHDCWFARTGYTGEDGFEVMLPKELGAEIWQKLLDNGVSPCGLGARDTLRLEAAMALYGQDVNDQTTPLEAGLGWLVHADKGDFIGKAALMAQKEAGVPRKIVGLKMEGRGIARHDYPVVVDGNEVGIVTSGSISPTLGGAIALAYVSPEYAKVGQAVQIMIRGKENPATVVKRPFYKRAS